jgi:hypothetical protein
LLTNMRPSVRQTTLQRRATFLSRVIEFDGVRHFIVGRTDHFHAAFRMLRTRASTNSDAPAVPNQQE